MANSKIIKTIVYTEDYQVLSSIARLHGHKIWEELAIAIHDHISKYKIIDTSKNSDTDQLPTVQEKTPEEVNRDSIKAKIKIYVETLNISPNDTRFDTYEGCKKVIEEQMGRKLRPDEINITMFDEVQQGRR